MHIDIKLYYYISMNTFQGFVCYLLKFMKIAQIYIISFESLFVFYIKLTKSPYSQWFFKCTIYVIIYISRKTSDVYWIL